MENTQDYQDYQDYRAEILGIVRSNASPGIMRNKLEDYHENDLADVFPDLSVAERRKLCRILNLDMLADIFEYIDERQLNIWMRWMCGKQQQFFPEWKQMRL